MGAHLWQQARSKESYSVNIAILDEQHQRLFTLVNKVESDLAAGRGEIIVDKVLRSLVDYTIYHFAEEEDLMHRYGFPGLAAHRVEHNALTVKIALAEEEYKAGKKGVLIPLMQYLHSWLEDHILKTDKQYSEFLNARGVY